MKLMSLFDGSGGFPLAASQCGITPIMASEVEPYPIAVTTSRFPQMRHLGDISKINGAKIEPVEIITFGSPCQDLSVAGKQAGLKHEENGDSETTRSGLFMEAVRIIKEMRRATHGKYPKFAVWENVPGAFSSNKGEDFRTVLEELIKISEPTAPPLPLPDKGRWSYADCILGDGWSIAYRVLDAQYWGVPQRRRRIYLVADFTGQCAGKILFEREGLQRHPTESGKPREEAPGYAQGSAGADDREGTYGVTTKGNGDAFISQERHTALTNGGGQAGQGYPCVMQPIAFTQNQRDELRILGDKAGCLQSEPGMKQQTYIIDNIGGQAEYGKESPVNGTLRSGAQGAIAYAVENHPADSRVNIDESGKCQTLTSRMGTGGGNVPMVMEPKPFCKGARGKFPGDAPTYKDADIANTLNVFDLGEARANELVVEAIPALTSSKASFFMRTEEELASTLVATDYKDPQMVCYCLQGNGIDRADTAGCNGKGWREDQSYTLNTIDRPAVCYTVDQGGGKSNVNVSENQSPTLTCTHDGAPAVAYGLDRASFNQGKNALYNFSVLSDQQPTLTAKGPGAVCAKYIVRRLTPTECARLQGFPDTWGHPIHKDTLSDEEHSFWQDVRNTHATINGRAAKEYTKAQMLSWYNKLHTDSAEYKMWGNGIALPNALYVMQGIAAQLQNQAKDDRQCKQSTE